MALSSSTVMKQLQSAQSSVNVGNDVDLKLKVSPFLRDIWMVKIEGYCCGLFSTTKDSCLAELEEMKIREFFTQSPSIPTGGTTGNEWHQHYVYQSIKNEHDIGLFRLELGRRDEPLQGRMVHVSMATEPEYEAMSYSWGSSAKMQELSTVDGVIHITDSLRSALTCLRRQARTRDLWADALCIQPGR